MDSQWLKTQFQFNPDKTKAGLAMALGLEPPAISKILHGGRQIKAQEYMIMRQYFGLPNDGEHALKRPANAAMITQLQSEQGFGETAQAENGQEWIIPQEILSSRTRTPPENIKIFQIRENVMEPQFYHGEYVLVDISDQKPSPPGIFIVSDGFGHMVRQCAYVPKSSPPQIRISATNKNFEPHNMEPDEFALVGRVIARLQWL